MVQFSNPILKAGEPNNRFVSFQMVRTIAIARLFEKKEPFEYSTMSGIQMPGIWVSGIVILTAEALFTTATTKVPKIHLNSEHKQG